MLHPPTCVTQSRRQWIYFAILLLCSNPKYDNVFCQTSPEPEREGANIEPPEVSHQRIPTLNGDNDQESKKIFSNENNDQPVVLSPVNKLTKLSKNNEDDDSLEVLDGQQNPGGVDALHEVAREDDIQIEQTEEPLSSSEKTTTNDLLDESANENRHGTTRMRDASAVVDDIQYVPDEDTTNWNPTRLDVDTTSEDSQPMEVTYGIPSMDNPAITTSTVVVNSQTNDIDNQTVHSIDQINSNEITINGSVSVSTMASIILEGDIRITGNDTTSDSEQSSGASLSDQRTRSHLGTTPLFSPIMSSMFFESDVHQLSNNTPIIEIISSRYLPSVIVSSSDLKFSNSLQFKAELSSGLTSPEVIPMSTLGDALMSSFSPIERLTSNHTASNQQQFHELQNATMNTVTVENTTTEKQDQPVLGIHDHERPAVFLQHGEHTDQTMSVIDKGTDVADETSIEYPIGIQGIDVDDDDGGDGGGGSLINSKESKVNGESDLKPTENDAKQNETSIDSIATSGIVTDTNFSLVNSTGFKSSSSMLVSDYQTVLSPVVEVINSTDEFDLSNNINTTGITSSTVKMTPPIRPTKASDLTDRRTKYNRLPTERSSREKSDMLSTESTFKSESNNLPNLHVPVAYLSVTMKCSWAYFCQQRSQFQRVFAMQLKKAVKMSVDEDQVIFFNVHVCKNMVYFQNSSITSDVGNQNSDNLAITVPLYVSDEWGIYSKSLTELLGVLIVRNQNDEKPSTYGEHQNVTLLPNLVLGVQLHRKDDYVHVGQKDTNKEQESDLGIIAAVTISGIAGICMLLLFTLLLVLKRRNGFKETTAGRCRPVTTDAYSLDSVSSIHSSFRRRKSRSSKRSYLNHAFDDPHAPTRKLNIVGLTSAAIDEETLAEEFKLIPMPMAKYDELPAGVEDKNRYANIIPFPETRVVLTPKADGGSDYINANYVRGYRGEQRRYIGCQAPLEDTVVDFWQMVWENQCKAVVMLTAIVEDGVNKCAPYFSESETLDSHRLFGDFQVTTKKRDTREDYIISTLQLKNLEKNLMRNVMHYWYTSWPLHQLTPSDNVTIAKLLVETRPFTKGNSGPLIVHCSPGTGRTGTVLAIDVCMHEFEFTRTVDIPQCVHRLRRDRGGCVQTAEQYGFIYAVLDEYASRITNQSGRSSVRSSVRSIR